MANRGARLKLAGARLGIGDMAAQHAVDFRLIAAVMRMLFEPSHNISVEP